MKLFLGTLMMWAFGAPVYLPWLLARMGYYKRWYLAPFAPPLMWGKAIYGWPTSLFFVVTPVVFLAGIRGEQFDTVVSWVIILSFILTFFMLLWTPRWAKPKWQRYLEDKHSWREIREVFIPVWREMDRKQWSQLLDSEQRIEQLVKLAREKSRG